MEDDDSIAATTTQTEKTTHSSAALKKKNKKTVEETYKKLEPIEHILLRPDTYIGSVEFGEQEMWIVDPLHGSRGKSPLDLQSRRSDPANDSSPPHFIKKTIRFCPGLYKVLFFFSAS